MSRRRTIATYQLVLAGFVGFLAGVIVTVTVLRDQRQPRREQAAIEQPARPAAAPPAAGDRTVRDAVAPAVLTPKPPARNSCSIARSVELWLEGPITSSKPLPRKSVHGRSSIPPDFGRMRSR